MNRNLLSQIDRINTLIKRKSTGTPKELAEKLKISERTLYNYINIMKELGAPIKYSKSRCSYYYEVQGSFIVKFTPISFAKDLVLS